MAYSVLDAPCFRDEAAAYAFVEERVWPDGPICPHCGNTESIGKLQGKSTRLGVYKCYACRKPFTVKVGTVFESSHIPLRIWLQAMYLLSSSKKGISSNQLHRTLGVTLKSAWFLSHRIREAMRTVGFTPMGGDGKVVEADETYSGDKDVITKRTIRGKSGHSSKRAIVSLVERGGSVRTFHVERADLETVTRIVKANVRRESTLHTDESQLYNKAKEHVAAHDRVKHSAGEYVRDDVHTNTVEGVFSIFKRGMHGVYQHCGEKHLHRYLAEYDFRYNNRAALGVGDVGRTDQLVKGVVGKRLTYR
jgi:transposase-like protein